MWQTGREEFRERLYVRTSLDEKQSLSQMQIIVQQMIESLDIILKIDKISLKIINNILFDSIWYYLISKIIYRRKIILKLYTNYIN